MRPVNFVSIKQVDRPAVDSFIIFPIRTDDNNVIIDPNAPSKSIISSSIGGMELGMLLPFAVFVHGVHKRHSPLIIVVRSHDGRVDVNENIFCTGVLNNFFASSKTDNCSCAIALRGPDVGVGISLGVCTTGAIIFAGRARGGDACLCLVGNEVSVKYDCADTKHHAKFYEKTNSHRR